MKLRKLNIRLICATLTALFALSACVDDFLYKSVNGKLEPGTPVDITIGLQVPDTDEANVGSRASTDTETDRTVYDLYLFIFNQETNQLKSKYYFSQIGSKSQIACDPAYSSTGSAMIERTSRSTGNITRVHTTAGPSRIVAVANCNRKGSAMILEKLNKVETLQDLRAIMVSTVDPDSKQPDFEQSLTVMSGYYCDNDDEHNAHHLTTPCDFVTDESDDNNRHRGYVDIQSDKLPGTLWLTPLQSRVKFIVISDCPKATETVPAGHFELESWQIYNIPGRTPLFCRGYSDETEPIEPNPVKSLVTTRFDSGSEVHKNDGTTYADTDEVFGFSFFVADNHPGKGDPEKIATYGDRAAWTGDDYTTSTPPDQKQYTNAPEGATYVVLRGKYSGASYVTEAGTNEKVLKNVTGNVIYTIFLGHDSENDFTDFNTYRNYNYTYTVKVSGVDKITVEVNHDIEDRPDAEGDIISTTSSIVTLDAHYEQRVISISKHSIKDAIDADNLQVSVTVPVFNVTRRAYKYDPDAPDADPNKALPYMEWLEFYEHKPNEVNSRYIYYTDARGNGTEKNTLDVKKFMKRLYEYSHDETAPEELTFTVYFSEYLYTTNPGTGQTVIWQDLLRNGQSRRFTMLGTSKFSADHNSSYTTSGTTFEQRCMQTIYDVDMAGLTQGWATEVIEEDIFEEGNPGVPVDMYNTFPRYQDGGAFQESKFGRQNCWRVNSGPGHDTWLFKSLINKDGYLARPSNKGANIVKNETNILSACMQRNRDLNGNGEIDREEMVWYIPSLEQMQLLYIGYGALTDDVQLYNAQREIRSGNVTGTKYKNRHYLTSSNNKKIWAEEGVSFSGLALGNQDTNSWQGDERYYVRCARSLGTSGEHNQGIPWNIQDYPEYQFQSIYEYTPYEREIEEVDNGQITNYKNHKRGRITMRFLNPQSLINVPRFTETPGLVNSFSENNFPTFQFEIADTVIAINANNTSLEVNRNQMETLFTSLKNEADFSPCNIIGPGWRLPTITELAIMQWAWNENWTEKANISQDYLNDPDFKKKFPNMNAKNIGDFVWHAFVGSNSAANLLSRTEYYYRYVGANGLTPTFNDRVRTYHVYEKTDSEHKFSIISRDLSTHSNNITIRCVRSYTAAQANAPVPTSSAARAATSKRKLRKK